MKKLIVTILLCVGLFLITTQVLGNSGRTELQVIQDAVTAMMTDNGLSVIENPVTTPTNDMGAYPDVTTAHGIAGVGYLLYNHDKDGDGTPDILYLQGIPSINQFWQWTTGTYTCDENGIVTQVTYESENELIKIQNAVDILMTINGLSVIENPVTIPTNDMTAFPDVLTPHGNPPPECYGYQLWNFDKDCDLNGGYEGNDYYINMEQSIGTYTCDENGIVTQVTEDEEPEPELPIIVDMSYIATGSLAYIGQLFTDLLPIVILVIGLPLGFWGVAKVIALIRGGFRVRGGRV